MEAVDWLAVGVELRLRTTEEGGRPSGIGGGDYRAFQYRPTWGFPWMSGADQTGAPVLCFGDFPLALGATTRAVLVPPYPQMMAEWERLVPGDRLRMFEGSRVCGVATVEWVAPTSERVGAEDRSRFCAWSKGDELQRR